MTGTKIPNYEVRPKAGKTFSYPKRRINSTTFRPGRILRIHFFGREELMQFENGVGHIRKSAKEHFITWLSDSSGWTLDAIRNSVGSSLDHLFDQVETSLGRVRPKHLDPKYIDLFILRR